MASEPGIKPQKEIGRLRVQIRKLEKERDKLFPELGRAAYQNYLGGRQEDAASSGLLSRLKELDEETARLNAQMQDLQAQAQQMKAAPPPATASAVCPACGSSVPPGVKFCGNCGAGLPPQAHSGAACPYCGSAVTPGAGFCGECGKPLQAATEQPSQAVQPPSPPAAPPPGPPAVSPGAPPPPPAAPPAPASAPSTGVTTCSACGAPIEEASAAFCGECGAKL